MPTLVLDPMFAASLRNEQTERLFECWEGLDVMSPMANDEHQDIQLGILGPLYQMITSLHLGQVRAGVNVAGYQKPWGQNYRCPDVVVYLNSNPAQNCGTHWVGGPDLAVEIISDGEDPHAKFEFYAQVNTQEVLLVERDPWQISLYHLSNGKLVLQGIATADNGLSVTCGSVGLTIALQAATPRPQLLLRSTTQTWVA